MRMMNCGWGQWLESRLAPGLSVVLIAALAAGCAHSPPDAGQVGSMGVPPVPEAPVFLRGAMALLFTNVAGFRAQAVLESGVPARQVAAGELMGQGGRLVFAPAFDKAASKRSPAISSAFIWDVPANSGYILNGPMQACASIASSVQFTNFTVSAAPAAAASERIDGHLCQPADAIVTASDGSVTAFRLWRAADLNGLPLRVTCVSASTPLTLTLSKSRLEVLPNDLFQPPNGFTRHESAQALIRELLSRQDNLKRRPVYPSDDSEAGAGISGGSPNRR